MFFGGFIGIVNPAFGTAAITIGGAFLAFGIYFMLVEIHETITKENEIEESE